MSAKKSFQVYYLLISEGTTEFNIFAYLTKNKFRSLFDKSDIKFSLKVEIIELGISQGKLDGVSDIKQFSIKYDSIKEKYNGQRRFFVLDKDLDDSSAIETLIKRNDDIVQFLEYNSEFLLLKFSGKNPKSPSGFENFGIFRTYCKTEFEKHFGKEASDLKDADFDLIFGNASADEIKNAFSELFSTLS